MKLWTLTIIKDKSDLDSPVGKMFMRNITSNGFIVKCYQVGEITDFAEARNNAVAMLRAEENVTPDDYILFLDLDERVVCHYNDLINILNSTESNVKAYRINIISPNKYRTLDTKIWRTGMVRLYRAIPAIVWSGKLHETITPALDNLGFLYSPMPVEVLHLVHIGYDYISESDMIIKNERNISILKSTAVEKEFDLISYYLGNCYAAIEQWDIASVYYKSALDLGICDKHRKTIENLLQGIEELL